jgi:hypothetical protein
MNNKLSKDLLEPLSILEIKAMVQPNKVDFVVSEVLKRKKVSRDRMALPEHSECCIRRFKLEHRTIFVRLSLLRISRIAPPTANRTHKSKLQISP